MANDSVKFFYTSDNKFLINLDNISLISSTMYAPTIAYNGDTKITHNGKDVYTSSEYLSGSYFNVYINGVDSPLTLKYEDGVVLMNLLNTRDSIFKNTHTITRGAPISSGENYLASFENIPQLNTNYSTFNVVINKTSSYIKQ